MSTRGGYGFVIDGKETIVYTGSGTEIDGLGNQIVQWLKTVSFERIKQSLANLQEVKASESVTPEDIFLITQNVGTIPRPRYGKEIETWKELLYLGENDPKFLLDSGYFVDGSWIISSPDLEYFYMIDLDKKRLEIYHGATRDGGRSGRFGKISMPDKNANNGHHPVLFAMYPLENLPQNLDWLEENKYDLMPAWFIRDKPVYDTSGDPTFIHPDNF